MLQLFAFFDISKGVQTKVYFFQGLALLIYLCLVMLIGQHVLTLGALLQVIASL